jgi:hypothetical protein
MFDGTRLAIVQPGPFYITRGNCQAEAATQHQGAPH